MSHLLLQANALHIPLAGKSVQCCVTSPPYWGLRDYGVEGQLGLEATPDLFVANMVAVFREVRRVLRDDGTVFMNLGDSYASSGVSGHQDLQGLGERLGTGGGKKHSESPCGRSPTPPGLKPKDLIGIPWRTALALQADGWYLRSDIIWSKPNPMPESVTDRPTKSHEYVFLLTKSERYYWDAEAVRERHADTEHTRARYAYAPSAGPKHDKNGDTNIGADHFAKYFTSDGNRNIRTVWNIPTESYPGAHFATYPRKLVEPCIKAGTSQKGCCPECGKPWVTEVDRQSVATRPGGNSKPGYDVIHGDALQYRFIPVITITGWRPGCSCAPSDIPLDQLEKWYPRPCLVLDPFCGSGTTGVVAEALHRNFVGLDLSREYLGMARNRIERPHKPIPRPGRVEHYPLFDRTNPCDSP